MEQRPLLELLELASERERLKRESGLTLLRARKAAGLSQRRLSLLAGVSQPYLSQVENGRQEVSTETLRKVTDAIDEYAVSNKQKEAQDGKGKRRAGRPKAKA